MTCTCIQCMSINGTQIVKRLVLSPNSSSIQSKHAKQQPAPTKNTLLPVPNPTTSIWLTSPDEELRKWKSSQFPPPNTAIAIIGSGFAGASLAYHLLYTYGCDVDIVMLEARDICSGATGRNGGHCFPSLYEGCQELTSKWGAEEARLQVEFENANFDELVKLIETENIDCDFE